MLKRSGCCHLTRCSAAAVSQRCGNPLACQGCWSSLASAASPCRPHHCTAGAPIVSSLSVASRTIVSTATTTAQATPSASPASPEARRDLKKRPFFNPKSMSPETLTYAACPMCGVMLHMRDMLFHITAVHKDQDVAYWTEECNHRIALYERITGVPMPPSTTRVSALDHALNEGNETYRMDNATRPVFLDREAFQSLLPTVTANGGYLCNWCAVKHAPFSTRDAFLLHVAKDHPELDFDAVEAAVPPPPSSPSAETPSAAARSANADGETATAQTLDSNTTVPSADALWEPAPGKPIATSLGVGVSGFGSPEVDARSTVPSRRMSGVKTVQQSNFFAAPLETRRVALSVPRSWVATRDPAPIGTVVDDEGASPAASAQMSMCFGEHHFPCELCWKVFASELKLLQHLEAKHAPLPPPFSVSAAGATKSAPSPTDAAATTTVAALDTLVPATTPSASPSPSTPARTAKPSDAPATICVTCDLCRNASKVFVLPSALFAHIRFRHRTTDATYEAERMMQEQRSKTLLSCSHCLRVFPNAVALNDHMWDHHGMRSGPTAFAAASVPSTSAATGLLSHTKEEDSLAAKYECPTLPSFSMNTRWWCDECERGFRNPQALVNHRNEKHIAVSELFPCPACRRVFHDPFTLENHVKAMHRSVSLVNLNLSTSIFCPHCNRGFLDYETLHMHSVKHHHKDPHSPVRPFVASSTASTAAEAAAAPSTSGSTTSEIAGPLKPRKVSRRKKTFPTAE
jgi:hypothetical protein